MTITISKITVITLTEIKQTEIHRRVVFFFYQATREKIQLGIAVHGLQNWYLQARVAFWKHLKHLTNSSMFIQHLRRNMLFEF